MNQTKQEEEQNHEQQRPNRVGGPSLLHSRVCHQVVAVRVRVPLVIAALITATLTACTPAQLAAFHASTPEVQQQWAAGVLEANRIQQWGEAVNANNAHSSSDCYGEMRKHFPASQHAKASAVITRESGGNASAKNSRSSASGCFQLLASLHRHRLPPGGSFFNAHDNTVGALNLWQQAGWSPW